APSPPDRGPPEIAPRLGAFSSALRAASVQTATLINSFIGAGFRGARLSPVDEPPASPGPLDVHRTEDLPRTPTLDARAFPAELQRLTRDLREITVAEFLITAIEPEPRDPNAVRRSPSPESLRTPVRYDIGGAGTKAYRIEHVGVWEMSWQKQPSGWQVGRWTAATHVVSRARAPIFTEITAAALAHNESFRQL